MVKLKLHLKLYGISTFQGIKSSRELAIFSLCSFTGNHCIYT